MITLKAAFLAALMAVESSGNPRAVGDGGKALGALQIHAAVVVDVNRIAGTHYRHRDMHDPKIAAFVCQTYLGHYATRARLGHEPTFEDLARIWNGGPQGHRKPATVAYWRRVRNAMQSADSRRMVAQQ